MNSVAYSPDGQYIISGSDDNTVRIWDTKTVVVVGVPLEGHTERVWSLTHLTGNTSYPGPMPGPFEFGTLRPVL